MTARPRSNIEQMAAALFDEDFYYQTYPDVCEAGLNAFDHFMSNGWRERRDASRTFKTGYYLDSNPDVAASGMNPLTHYVMAGVFEGRRASPTAWQVNEKAVVLGAVPAAVRAANWQPVYDFDRPLTALALAKCLNDALDLGSGQAVLSLSHDHYIGNVGGVQSIVATEAQVLTQRGWTYIHLSPARPLPTLAQSLPQSDSRLVLTINGRREGVVRELDLVQLLDALRPASQNIRFVVHHAMGFSPATILALARRCRRSPAYFWTHDFFALCTNPFLLRNDLRFCGAPSPDSTACQVCNNGATRASHVAAMKEIFAELKPVVVAPSTSAAEFWRTHTELHARGTRIVPPAVLRFHGEPVTREPGPLRVAFIGPPATHKGWTSFAALLSRHKDDPRYEFFRLGVGESAVDRLKVLRVEVTSDQPDAMIDALRARRIDVVVNWYSCFETFSFATHEAMAAGAFVVTRYEAGNVWPAIAAASGERGLALHSEAQLRALFLGDELIAMAGRPRSHGQLTRTSGTAEILLEEASHV